MNANRRIVAPALAMLVLVVSAAGVWAYPGGSAVEAAAREPAGVPALLEGLGDFEVAHIVSLLVEEVYATDLEAPQRRERLADVVGQAISGAGSHAPQAVWGAVRAAASDDVGLVVAAAVLAAGAEAEEVGRWAVDAADEADRATAIRAVEAPEEFLGSALGARPAPGAPTEPAAPEDAPPAETPQPPPSGEAPFKAAPGVQPRLAPAAPPVANRDEAPAPPPPPPPPVVETPSPAPPPVIDTPSPEPPPVPPPYPGQRE